MALSEGLVFCMCNPLLDISANVPAEYLTKYDVKAGNAILAEDKHLPVYEDLIKNFEVEYIAGGSAQNSMRVFQWMLQKPNVASYVGCTGRDAYGEQLRKSASQAGVNVQYMEVADTPTGTCAVLVVGKERSLIANLAAANKYHVDHLMTEPIQQLMKAAAYYYISGFFLTVSPASIMHVAKHAAETNKTFMMNLSAPFVSQFFGEPQMAVMPYVDILFGNEDEAAAFSAAQKLESTDVSVIASKICALPKVNTARPRMVVFTQGANSTIVAYQGTVQTFPVPKIPSELIIDTNGAGDAFVGGFLSQLVAGKPVAEAVRAGHYAAGVIIQRSGCTYPPTPSFPPSA